MKNKGLTIILLGLVVAAAGFAGLYWLKTSEHRAMLHCEAPELAWLQNEFSLEGDELQKVAELHNGYQASCRELCRQIDEKNAELKVLLNSSAEMTPEIENLFDEAGALRAQCQKQMFSHFLEVSRSMPPEQGRRYLGWIQERTLGSEHDIHTGHFHSQ